MEIEELLRTIDLSEYEIKVFLALNRLTNSTATLIAKLSKVPRNKTYEVLEKLKNKGFVMELPTIPKKFQISNLEKIKEVIKDNQERLIRLEQESNNLILKLSQQKLLTSKEPLTIIKGQKNIVQKITAETAKAETEVLACFRSFFDSATNFRTIKEVIDKRVKVRFIGAYNSENESKIKRLLELGVEFRIYDEKLFGPHGTRFSVIDNKAARITIGKPEIKDSEEYLSIWIESPSLINLLKREFENMWKKSKRVVL